MTVRRRRIRALLLAAAALFLLLVLAPVLAVALGLTLDARPWRAQMAQAIGNSLQREVVIDGVAEIELSLRPVLHVGGIRIFNPPGFSAPVLATLGDTRLRLELLPLLRAQLRVLELGARDAKLRFELLPDGRANWHLNTVERPAEVTAAPQREDIAGLAVDHILIERVAVEFIPASGRTHSFTLDRLDARAAPDAPVTMHLDGRVEGRFGYVVDLHGGPLGTLLAGREPWPMKVDLAFLATTLRLEGELFRLLEGGHADLWVALQTDELSQIEELLQVELPPVGATRLTTRFRWQPGLWRLDRIDGSMGDTRLQGRLALARPAVGRPRLSGDLMLPVLELRPFLGQPANPQTPPASLLDTYRELETQRFDLRRLNDLDIDLDLAVGRWQSLPGDIRDARLQLHLQDGVLHSPVSVETAGVPMAGALDIDSRAATPRFSLALASTQHPLGGLARLFADLDSVEGEVERSDLRLAAQGATPGELLRSLSVAVSLDRARLTYGNQGGNPVGDQGGPDRAAASGGRPVEFRLDRFEASMPAGGALTGTARGALLGTPYKALFSTGPLADLVRTAHWPLKLQLDAAGARLAIDGHYGLFEARGDVDLRLALDAPRAGSVARWLGLAPEATVPLHLGGRMVSAAGSADLWLRDFRLGLGRTRLTGEFGRVGADGPTPLLKARLDADELDVAELQSLLPARAPTPAPSGADATPGAGLMLELPILPYGIDLRDTDLQLSVRRLRLPAVELADIRFDAEVREGRIAAAPFSAVVAGTAFSGQAGLDLRGAVPELALQLAAGPVDIGELLHRLQVADGVEARADTVSLALTLRGARLGEMLSHSELAADLHGGRWTPHDPAGQPLLSIAVGHGRIEAAGDEPLRLTLDGAIDGNALRLKLDSGSLSEFAEIAGHAGSVGRVPLRLRAEAADTRLELQGHVPLPLGQRDGELTLSLSGERLDRLDGLVRTSLPPWGPWSLSGRFVERGRRYEMPDLALQVGASQLGGHGAIDFGAARPRIELELNAPKIQLDDFALRQWSALARAEAPAAAGPEADATDSRAGARAAAQRSQQLLARDTLLRADAEIDIEVAQVNSGADRLGDGRLHARLRDARLTVDPVQVSMPGGTARVALSYEPLPGDREVRVQAQTRIEHFDYAVLARRRRPGSEAQGRLSLDLDLASTAPLDALMPVANGRIDVTVWPVNLHSGSFDLWVVNLFVALLPTFTGSASASRVNCAVAHFDVHNGLLTEDQMLVDTTRMRVGGTARVDFRDESVLVRLQPRPKRPQFFSVAAPVEVSGHIGDFAIGVPPGAWFGTALRFVSSVVTTPVEMAFGKPLPPDGADVCGAVPRGDEKSGTE